MPFYKIRPGFTFNVAGAIVGAGAVIELGSDIAVLHQDKLDFVAMAMPVLSDVQTSATEAAAPSPAVDTEAAPTADHVDTEPHQVG